MKTKAPMKGLLAFSFHSASKSISTNLLISLVLAGGFLIVENAVLLAILVLILMLNLPMAIIMTLASKDGKWERYQLTMPIKRSDLLLMQYLSVLFATIVAAALLITVMGISTVLHDELFDYGFITIIINTAHSFGLPLLMTGVLFPLASSKIGAGREQSLLTVCMIAAMGVNVLVPNLGNMLGMSAEIFPVLIFAISVIIFIVSYYITRAMYAKMNF